MRSKTASASLSRILGRLLLQVERINSWLAAVSSWALLAMTLIVTYQVIARYLLSSPTVWAWDITVQLMLMMLMLGMAQAYQEGAHVRVDILTSHLGERHRAILDIMIAPLFFFVTLVLVWTSWNYFYSSFESMQRASTAFGSYLFPVKFTLPLGGALLLLQGIVKLIYDLRVAFSGRGHAAGDY